MGLVQQLNHQNLTGTLRTVFSRNRCLKCLGMDVRWTMTPFVKFLNVVDMTRTSSHMCLQNRRSFQVKDNGDTQKIVQDVGEEDNFKVLRKAAKEYRVAMREYYKAAVEAFAKGNPAKAGTLLIKQVEAEEQPEISDAYSVSAVPYFVFFKDGKSVDTLEGADPSSLANKVAKVAGSITAGEPAAPASLGMAAGPTILETVKEFAKENGSSKFNKQVPSGLSGTLEKRLQELIDSHPVMLFMKGTPDEPKCGFSKKVVGILKEENVKFGSFDILSDNEVREGLKKYSNWPTFPQLFCKGELVGGSDIAIAMHESGELKEVFRDHGVGAFGSDEVKGTSPSTGKGGILEATGLSVALTSRLETLVNSSSVMLFMKGTPDEPKCGFSRKVVEILHHENVDFKSFDILSDDEVRQGLKVYSNWSSYPQLYIKGELIGGSDIVLEMQKSGELKKVFAEKGIFQKEEALEDRLKKLINSSPTMLFMKGVPDAPRCGFSSKVVDVLRKEGVSFGSFDILTDEEVRQGLKVFSNWPTFPQLYYKGELVGGCDIILELHKSGELKSTLSE